MRRHEKLKRLIKSLISTNNEGLNTFDADSIFGEAKSTNDTKDVKSIVSANLKGIKQSGNTLIEVSEQDLFVKLTSNWNFKQRGRKSGKKRGRPSKAEPIDDMDDDNTVEPQVRKHKPIPTITKIVLNL